MSITITFIKRSRLNHYMLKILFFWAMEYPGYQPLFIGFNLRRGVLEEENLSVI